ncbi:MAG: hypothetical protein FJ290_32405, partial [Planctomycetes bacterium]|nr:hypothetical protein [Planctomycetota bacterium]
WAGRSVWLELDGAAYQADAWLNGRWVGRTTGPFVPGRFDATLGAKLGERNSLAVRVVGSPADFVKGGEPFRPAPARKLVTSQELGDHGTPPLGLWQSARLKSAGPCLLRDLAVETLDVTEAAARLRVSAEIANFVNEKLEVVFAGTVGEDRLKPALSVAEGAGLQAFEQKATVEGNRASRVEAEVIVPRPKLWWPSGFGEQPLYRLVAGVKLDGGAVSDEAALTFGIRSVELAPYDGVARLRVNGRGLDIRGVMWLPADAALRLDASRYERLLARARECGFNTLRVVGGGLAETDLFYGLCDREGLLVLQELPLAGDGQGVGADEYLANAAAAVRRIRSHPSLVAWCVGGAAGGSPDPRLTAEAAALCQRLDPQRRLLGDSPRTGPAALWAIRSDPASGRTHWLGASLRHVAAPPSPSALCEAPDWPSGEEWVIASARSAAPYGAAASAGQHITKAQLAQAAAVRAAAERHRLAPAAEILWQLNEPAPSASPALVDASGTPKPASYFLRRALADVVILADFGGEAPSSVAVGRSQHVEVCVESATGPLRNAQATATVLDRLMNALFVRQCRFDAEAGVVERPLAFDWSPEVALAGDVAFLHLRLDDAAGKPLASNLYWLGVSAPRRAARRPLRVAWLTARPRGLLADDSFLAATGIQVTRPREGEAPAEPKDAGAAPRERRLLGLEGFDAIVVDAASVFADYTDDTLKGVAAAIEKGCGLLVEGADRFLLDSSLGPVLPVRPGAAGGARGACSPTALVPDHPALARVAFALCPPLPRRDALVAREPDATLAELDSGH